MHFFFGNSYCGMCCGDLFNHIHGFTSIHGLHTTCKFKVRALFGDLFLIGLLFLLIFTRGMRLLVFITVSTVAVIAIVT